MIPSAQVDELGILSMVSIFTGILDTILSLISSLTEMVIPFVAHFHCCCLLLLFHIYNMGILSQLRATVYRLDVNLSSTPHFMISIIWYPFSFLKLEFNVISNMWKLVCILFGIIVF